MAAIALFAIDVFAAVVTITGVAVGYVIARTFIALWSRQLRVSPADHALGALAFLSRGVHA